MPDPAQQPLSAAFERFYHRHFDFVWRALWRLGVPEACVDDAAQDAFVIVHRRFADIEADATRAWLFGVARGVAANYRRSDQRHRRKLAAVPEPKPARELDELVGQHRQIARLERAINQLAPARREVYVLIELEGLSAPEVADALGCKLNTVYSRLRRARADLAAAVEPERARSATPLATSRPTHD